jgi:hypothetical protein
MYFAGSNGINNGIGQLQVLGRGRIIIDKQVLEYRIFFHGGRPVQLF